MGYELERFQGDIDEELICPICSSVLEEPLQVKLNKNFRRIENVLKKKMLIGICL